MSGHPFGVVFFDVVRAEFVAARQRSISQRWSFRIWMSALTSKLASLASAANFRFPPALLEASAKMHAHLSVKDMTAI